MVAESSVWRNLLLIQLIENKKESDTNCSIKATGNNVFIFTGPSRRLITECLIWLGGALYHNEVFTLLHLFSNSFVIS